LVPLCRKHGLAIIPWSPLAGGVLAGRYPLDGTFPEDSRAARAGDFFRVRITRRGREVALKVAEMAQARGMTVSQLALLWVKDQPGVTAPIIGPRTLAHLEDALPVLEMALAAADRLLFDALVHPGNAVADFHKVTAFGNTNDWMQARIVD
jgi:aryl-alcohol dehydrogenase-like predicted oxidoreductase